MTEKLTEQEIFSTLEKLMGEVIDLPKEKLTKENSIDSDLGIDSLDKANLGYLVEEKFGISIEDDQMIGFKTVGEYVNYIKENLQKRDFDYPER